MSGIRKKRKIGQRMKPRVKAEESSQSAAEPLAEATQPSTDGVQPDGEKGH